MATADLETVSWLDPPRVTFPITGDVIVVLRWIWPYAPFVTVGARLVLIVAAVITTMTLAACGGNADRQMRATLTDDGCAYKGDKEAAAGRFTIDVENQTKHPASFAFLRLANG